MTLFGAFHSTAASQSLDGATPGEIRTFDWLQDVFNAGGEAAASVVFPRDAQDLGTVAETQRLQDHILSIHPEWRDRWLLVRVVVGVVSVVNIRSTDFTILQHVKLLWIFEGDKYLRAHNGACYFNEEGSWRPFSGLISDVALARLQRNMLCLEGLLRSLPRNTRPTVDDCIAAVASLRSFHQDESDEEWFACLRMTALNVETAMQYGGAERHAGDMQLAPMEPMPAGERGVAGTSKSWTSAAAQAVMRCSCTLQAELLNKKLITYFAEWCGTECPRNCGFARPDSCWLFVEEGTTHLRCVQPAPHQNIYVRVPHPMQDVVFASTKTRVMKFLTSTFFDNAPALKCQFAAMTLVLRGQNITRAFWTIGPGGVGQSMNSLLIANVFGDLHGFLDMNVFFSRTMSCASRRER